MDNEYYGNILQKPVVACHRKMTEKLFLDAKFKPLEFPIIKSIVHIRRNSSTVCQTYCLKHLLHVSK